MSMVTHSTEKLLNNVTVPPTPMIDLATELLEMILKNLDCGRNSMNRYRLVHPRWATIIDNLALKRKIDICPKVMIVDEYEKSELTIFVPLSIWNQNGNHFPSKSLLVGGKYHGTYRQSKVGIWKHKTRVPLNQFLSKFGVQLLSVTFNSVEFILPSSIDNILSHLSNIKVLRMRNLYVNVPKLSIIYNSIPVLPNLTVLELSSVQSGSGPIGRWEDSHSSWLCKRFVDAYGDQVECLEMKLPKDNLEFAPFQKLGSPRATVFQKLRELKIFHPDPNFSRLSCIPPLKSLTVVGIKRRMKVDMNTLLLFMQKMSNTLENLHLDIPWSQLLNKSDKLNTIQSYGKLSTDDVIFLKLRNFTVAYPANDAEAAIIRNTFLLKFPALQVLRFFHCGPAYRKIERDAGMQIRKEKIRGFLDRENYWQDIPTLQRISVWFAGEKTSSSSRAKLITSVLQSFRGDITE